MIHERLPQDGDLVDVVFRDSLLIIKITSEKNRNALSIAVLDQLDAAVSNVEKLRRDVEIVFTGTGNVFASGASLQEISQLEAETARGFALRGHAILERIVKLRFKTVAAINGYCFGGGLDLALSCSLRIAASSSTFCHPGTGLGIITGWGGTQRLPRLVGGAVASEMFFTAEPISANRARSIGLIDAIDDSYFDRLR